MTPFFTDIANAIGQVLHAAELPEGLTLTDRQQDEYAKLIRNLESARDSATIIEDYRVGTK